MLKVTHGEVTEVYDGPAYEKGVKVGWVMSRIDGEPYSEALIQQKVAGAAPYIVIFKEAEVDFSGSYTDSRGGTTRISQAGAKVIATSPDQFWSPATGTVS